MGKGTLDRGNSMCGPEVTGVQEAKVIGAWFCGAGILREGQV